MKYSLFFIALSMLVSSEAANVLFKVVAPSANPSASGNVVVSINGVTTTLQAADPDVPVYTGSADLPDNASYKYVVDGVAEAFTRTLEAGRGATRNDFYDRSVTYAQIPPLPQPFKEKNWSRDDGELPMWDSNYIPSIFITGDQAQMDTLVNTVPRDPAFTNTKFTFVGPDEVLTFENCQFRLHNGGRKKNKAKQSWEWYLPSGQYIYDRNWIKIRHMEEDPTQIREKLYADVLHAMGTYGNRANMVRFFINKEGFGTFNMLDDIPMYSYIRSMFYGGSPPAEMGPLFDGATGADFNVHPADVGYYSWLPSIDSAYDSSVIAPLAEALANTKMAEDSQVAAFESKFDVDQFLRFMVMEYLTAHWDGYWMFASNCGAYQDPQDGKWYFLGQDYDATFGVNLAMPEGRDFIKVRYEDFTTRFTDSVMINRLLENPGIKARFESYLRDTVSVLFNPDVLGQHVVAYHDFILPDLKWDRSIKQRSPGFIFGWTFEQTTENLYSGVSAPNANGGGADWGLIEWITAKSQFVSETYTAVHESSASLPASASASANTTTGIVPAGIVPAGIIPAGNASSEFNGKQIDMKENNPARSASVNSSTIKDSSVASSKGVSSVGFAVIAGFAFTVGKLLM